MRPTDMFFTCTEEIFSYENHLFNFIIAWMLFNLWIQDVDSNLCEIFILFVTESRTMEVKTWFVAWSQEVRMLH